MLLDYQERMQTYESVTINRHGSWYNSYDNNLDEVEDEENFLFAVCIVYADT